MKKQIILVALLLFSYVLFAIALTLFDWAYYVNNPSAFNSYLGYAFGSVLLLNGLILNISTIIILMKKFFIDKK